MQGWGEFLAAVALRAVKRSHGSGHLYLKHGSCYGRWRGVDGRLVNKKIGKIRTRGAKDGITRADAERGLRRLVEAERRQLAPARSERSPSVDDVADELRGRLAVEGARLSYRQNCESMQRVHVSPAIGRRPGALSPRRLQIVRSDSPGGRLADIGWVYSSEGAL